MGADFLKDALGGSFRETDLPADFLNGAAFQAELHDWPLVRFQAIEHLLQSFGQEDGLADRGLGISRLPAAAGVILILL